jgi:ComF family protein
VLAPPPLKRCIAALDYAYPWASLLHRFKFQGETGWARLFGQLMVDAPGAHQLLQDSDWLLPVPLSTKRLGERGYNQSWALCKAIASITSRQGPAENHAMTHPRNDVLLKVLDTTPQHEIGRKERLNNLHGAFAVHPKTLYAVRGQRITLVDDIMTTGATLHAAAVALRQAGAQHVQAWVLAKTPPA